MAAPALAGYSPESGGYTPTTSEPTTEDGATCDQNPAMPDTCDGSDGWYPVSVVGKEGYFCAQGPICTSEVGNCPGVHGDLTFGSSCVSISEGVYGCVPNTECPTTESTPVHDEYDRATRENCPTLRDGHLASRCSDYRATCENCSAFRDGHLAPRSSDYRATRENRSAFRDRHLASRCSDDSAPILLRDGHLAPCSSDYRATCQNCPSL
ncbi:uncharacterized protein PITG_17825 [Phytophthora infestans T30-4]|uniref:Uncharacterized protein n=1 Tax=Phytophthora infestans (strain T30-4) TaxID=403677 RepID=D0NW56_PHYIT|nr:uncharacterized protein PITG_17825 [Phytophthora infestans T30-4]EEY66941.1 conserved hypothetical protein [Phytophthora infestans T30-4]|eukprot:XP_002896659.1 conserved hypothetical protein [Phytophthora infestans T30-4]